MSVMTNKRLANVIQVLSTLVRANTWDYEDLRDSEGKTFMLRFLPYIDGIDSGAIGYRDKYRHGRMEEFFTTLEAARERMNYLIDAGAIEDAEILKKAPAGQGNSYPTLMDEWKDSTEPTED